MIGLIFLSVFIIWILFSIYIGIKIPIWCKSKRPKTIALLCIPLVFFAPVADEIIAYPQMMALCNKQQEAHLTIPENEAKGLKIYYYHKYTYLKLWSGVNILQLERGYKNIKNDQFILYSKIIEPAYGFLGMPEGSSGSKTTLILNNCPQGGFNMIEYSPSYLIEENLKHLNLNVIENYKK